MEKRYAKNFKRNIFRFFLSKNLKGVNVDIYIQCIMKEPSKFNSDIAGSLDLPEDVVIDYMIKDYFIELSRQVVEESKLKF